MFDQLENLQREMLARKELFTLGAKIQKKSFDALVAEGFTPDQAIRIVAGQGGGVKTNS